MNGPIGKQMVDTLVESSANFEVSAVTRLITPETHKGLWVFDYTEPVQVGVS